MLHIISIYMYIVHIYVHCNIYVHCTYILAIEYSIKYIHDNVKIISKPGNKIVCDVRSPTRGEPCCVLWCTPILTINYTPRKNDDRPP